MTTLTTNIREWFWDIFFPSYCLGCGETLQYSKREVFCPVCHMDALISDTHLAEHHPLRQRLISAFPFELVLSKYRFPNNSQLISNLIYGLKYQNLRYIGHIEGREYGQIIAPLLREKEVSALIPVPLHWRKQLKRGYNQSLEFAIGLAESTHIPIHPDLVRRTKNTHSQTTLNKTERIQNMENAFQLKKNNPSFLPQESHHFLLVDDVATSGITLAEMARTLQRTYVHSRFSVCTLAYKDY